MIYRTLFALYFGLTVGLAWANVGQLTEVDVIKWYFPIQIALFMLLCFILGVLTGSEEQ